MESGKNDCMIYLSTILIFHSYLKLPEGCIICIPNYSMLCMFIAKKTMMNYQILGDGNYIIISKGCQSISDDFRQKMADSDGKFGDC